jgi:hypothetical protein
MATTTKKAILLATSLASITATGTSLAHANDQGLTKSIISKAERIKRTETHARKAEEINKRSEDETNQKRATDAERKQKEEQARLEQEKAAKEKPKEEAPKAQETTPQAPAQNTAPVTHEDPRFGSDGLLIMDGGGNANQVYNLLNSIPGKMNGGDYHKQTGVDNLIDTLTTSQAFWVLYQLEGPGFGQLADGYAGFDTHESHQALITNQLNNRFSGSIHQLLKVWGTLGYSGY